MSTTAGVFSETTSKNIQAKAEEIMMDDRTKQNFIAHVDAIKAIEKVQTAKIDMLKSKKDYTVEVSWINNCAIVAEDCDSCSVGGNELSTNTQLYTIDKCKQTKFSVKGYKFINNDYDAQELIAKGLLTADKVISEAIAREFLIYLAANAGISNWTLAGEIGTVVGNEVQIATADFDAEAIGYIMKVYLANHFTNPQTISGNLLYNEWQNAFFASGAFANTAGDQGRFQSLNPAWDIFTFNAAAMNTRMFGLSTGSLAAASKTYYGESVEEYGKEGWRWSIPSRWIDWLTLEVHMNTNCENDIIGFDYAVKGRYGIWNNPEGCEDGNNGILQFVAV